VRSRSELAQIMVSGPQVASVTCISGRSACEPPLGQHQEHLELLPASGWRPRPDSVVAHCFESAGPQVAGEHRLEASAKRSLGADWDEARGAAIERAVTVAASSPPTR